MKYLSPISTMSLVGALMLFMAVSSILFARDLGQWASVDPSVSKWYKSLMMPDNPTISCCGGADAYYADLFENDGDRYVAIITDTRDDGPLGRHHVELALLWHFKLGDICKEHVTVRTSSGLRSCEEVEDRLPDGRHAWLWWRS